MVVWLMRWWADGMALRSFVVWETFAAGMRCQAGIDALSEPAPALADSNLWRVWNASSSLHFRRIHLVILLISSTILQDRVG